MADYRNSSVDPRGRAPENAVDAHEWSRLEPVLKPEQLVRRFLWGIPLVSQSMNPITRQYDRLEAEDLKDMINRAISSVEMESKIDVFPVKRSEKVPFDRNEMADAGYIRANYRPIISVDKLAIAPGNSHDILIINPNWIAHDGFSRGLVRIVTTIGTSGSGYLPGAVGAGQAGSFVSIMAGVPWLPAFWTMEYTTGFPDGQVPRSLNELIGCYAAIDALSLLATTNRTSSQSIGMDGGSQSISTGGPQVYDGRMKVLEDRKQALLKKFRAIYGNKFAIGNI